MPPWGGYSLWHSAGRGALICSLMSSRFVMLWFQITSSILMLWFQITPSFLMLWFQITPSFVMLWFQITSVAVSLSGTAENWRVSSWLAGVGTVELCARTHVLYSLPEPRGPHFKPIYSCLAVKLKKLVSDFPHSNGGNRHGTWGAATVSWAPWHRGRFIVIQFY